MDIQLDAAQTGFWNASGAAGSWRDGYLQALIKALPPLIQWVKILDNNGATLATFKKVWA